MFDRGKPSEAASPSTSPDTKMAPTQGSYMNNEQFCLFSQNPYVDIIQSDVPFRLIVLILSAHSDSCVPPRSSQ